MGISICSHLSQVGAPKQRLRSLLSFNSSSLGGCPNLQAADSRQPCWHPQDLYPGSPHLKPPQMLSNHVRRSICHKKTSLPWMLQGQGEFLGVCCRAVCLSPIKSTNPNSDLYCSLQATPFQTPRHWKSGWLGKHSELTGRYVWMKHARI